MRSRPRRSRRPHTNPTKPCAENDLVPWRLPLTSCLCPRLLRRERKQRRHRCSLPPTPPAQSRIPQTSGRGEAPTRVPRRQGPTSSLAEHEPSMRRSDRRDEPSRSRHRRAEAKGEKEPRYPDDLSCGRLPPFHAAHTNGTQARTLAISTPILTPSNSGANVS